MSPMAIKEVAPFPSKPSGKPRTPSSSTAWSPVPISKVVAKLSNPIREIIGGIDLNAAPSGDKPFLNLSLGDPCVFGNMPPAPEALQAIENSLRSGKSDGYPPSVGYTIARQAVADYFRSDDSEGDAGGSWSVKMEDVVMTHGASGALEMAFSTLADASNNIVLPRPLFSAYETIAGTTGCEVRYYDLLPDKEWECDFASLDDVVDDRTAFVLICNPSNPTSSNYSAGHLREIADYAARKRVVVLADEVYAGMAWSVTGERPASADAPRVQGKFNRGVFTPFASVAPNTPALVLGAVSKRWLAPGWRTGWVIVHDPINVLSQVREGLAKWAFRIQGPSSTMQCALPELFAKTPELFFVKTMASLESTGRQLFDRLSQIPGLKPLLPQGAMYLMCGGLTPENFGFETDAAFIGALKAEENILILPGSCFRLDGFMRFVTTVPVPILMQACDRIEAFCARHRRA